MARVHNTRHRSCHAHGPADRAAGALTEEGRTTVQRDLAAALLPWEGAPDTAFFRAQAWSYLIELPEGAQTTAEDDTPRFLVGVTVPQGALSERRRAGLVQDTTKTVRAAAGHSPDDALRAASTRSGLPALHRPGGGSGLGPVLAGQRARETAKGLKPCRRRMWGTTRIMASVARAVPMSPRSSTCSGCQPRSPSRPVTVFFAFSSSPER